MQINVHVLHAVHAVKIDDDTIQVLCIHAHVILQYTCTQTKVGRLAHHIEYVCSIMMINH